MGILSVTNVFGCNCCKCLLLNPLSRSLAGLSRVNSYGYGDHYLHVKIHVPAKLTEMQRSLIEAYAQTEIDRVGNVKLSPPSADQANTNANNDNSSSDTKDSNTNNAGSTDDDDSIMSKIKKKLF